MTNQEKEKQPPRVSDRIAKLIKDREEQHRRDQEFLQLMQDDADELPNMRKAMRRWGRS